MIHRTLPIPNENSLLKTHIFGWGGVGGLFDCDPKSKTAKMAKFHIFGGGGGFLFLILSSKPIKSQSPIFLGVGEGSSYFILNQKLVKSQSPIFLGGSLILTLSQKLLK